MVKAKPGYKLVKSSFGKQIEIPNEWEIKKFGELIAHTCLGTTQVGVVGGLGIPLLKMGNLTYGGFNYKKLEKIQLSNIENIEKYILQENDFLFNTRNTDVLVGKCAVWKNDFSQAIFNNNLLKINFSKSIENSDYVSYFLNSNLGRRSLRRLVNATTSVAAIYYGSLKLLKFPLPTLLEQRKITSILSNVNKLIQSYDNSIDSTKKLKIGLMQTLLTRGIGHKKFKKIRWLFGKEIEIPEEWKVKKNEDIFEFLTSGTNARSDLNESGEIGYIHYGDIHTKWNLVLNCDSDKIPQIDKEKVSHLPLLKDGDLIIADASEDVGGSGTSILINNIKNKKIVAGLHTIVLRSNDENISPNFLKYLTSMNSVKIQIVSYVTGSKVFGLSKKSCRYIKVPFPKLSEQEKIASILSSVDTKISELESKKSTLEILKKGLMQKLLTGEIRIMA